MIGDLVLLALAVMLLVVLLRRGPRYPLGDRTHLWIGSGAVALAALAAVGTRWIAVAAYLLLAVVAVLTRHLAPR